MNTQCPHCRTVFRIDAKALDAAGGRVRCAHCRRVFDAHARLQKELPLERTKPASGSAPASGVAAAPARVRPEPDRPQGPIARLLLSEHQHDRSGPAQRPSRSSLLGWAVANVVLLLGLCLQLVFVQREAFAQDPTLRRLLDEMCAVAGCELSPLRAVDRIELVRRKVYAHPNVDRALIIDAIFVNNADFPQPYPTLMVSLGDLRGEPLVRRNFSPREYKPELGADPRMAPGSAVRVTLEVRDPGRGARTFELDFL